MSTCPGAFDRRVRFGRPMLSRSRVEHRERLARQRRAQRLLRRASLRGLEIRCCLCTEGGFFCCLRRCIDFGLLFALVFVVAPVFADIWSDCGTNKDIFKVGTVSILPDPPVKGKNLTVIVTGTISKEITKGNLKLDVKYSFVTIMDKTLDLCQETSCPIPAGEFKKSITDVIPDVAPTTAVYYITATASDETDEEILCAKVQFKMGS